MLRLVRFIERPFLIRFHATLFGNWPQKKRYIKLNFRMSPAWQWSLHQLALNPLIPARVDIASICRCLHLLSSHKDLLFLLFCFIRKTVRGILCMLPLY